MNELVVADRAADWHRLKALVLDSVSSPITRRVYNLGLDEFIAWYGEAPRPRFYEGNRERLARCVGGPRPRLGFPSMFGLQPCGSWPPVGELSASV
jgi:hypothetical protein